MPRKVDPRRGEDGYDDWLPVTLADAEAAALAGMLGIDPGSSRVDDLRSAVADIGNTYWRWRGRGAGAFDRAQARRALEDLLAAGRVDYAALTALNERALQCVHDSLLMMRLAPVSRGDSVMVALMEGRLDEATLRHAVHDAIARLKAKKGPEREGELAWAVAELCRLYEALKGRPATHSNKGKYVLYQDEPQSKAGLFVRACFQLIDPSVLPSRVSHSMRLFIESRR